MHDWLKEKVKLGRSDLFAGRLGLGSSYGAPARAFEAAYAAGCNYFYWGALRLPGMAKAIRNIVARGERDKLIVVVQVFRRRPTPMEKSLMRGLKRLGLDYADVLLLGWYNKPPKPQILNHAQKLREQGAFHYLGLSTHNRSLIPQLAKDERFDLFHIRYNAANRGAETDLFPHIPDDRPGIVAFNATKRRALMISGRIPPHEKRPTAGDCYRFALTNPSVDVVITAPSNTRQLHENLVETARGPMSRKELEWMRRIGDYIYKKKRDY